MLATREATYSLSKHALCTDGQGDLRNNQNSVFCGKHELQIVFKIVLAQSTHLNLLHTVELTLVIIFLVLAYGQGSALAITHHRDS